MQVYLKQKTQKPFWKSEKENKRQGKERELKVNSLLSLPLFGCLKHIREMKGRGMIDSIAKSEFICFPPISPTLGELNDEVFWGKTSSTIGGLSFNPFLLLDSTKSIDIDVVVE